MSGIATVLAASKPRSITTCALGLRRTSSFIPSLWGVMVGEHDRVLLLDNILANNRLTEKLPHVHFRKLCPEDSGKKQVCVRVPSMDRLTWDDRLFDMSCSEHERCTYLLEVGHKIVGYLTVHGRHRNSLMIDEIAVDKAYQGCGYGGALLRWAETLARFSNHKLLELWAIENEVGFYRKNEYEVVGSESLTLGEEKYVLMVKRLSARYL